jgi:3-phosphoshikimate 1-carboxyvinyltransferase
MKSLKLKPGLLPSRILIPGSKSYANRALIIAAIRKNTFKLHHLPDATDVSLLVDSLRQIGVTIRFEAQTCTVSGSFPETASECEPIIVGEGGTTARFLACLLLRADKPYTLVLGERLKERPWDEFIAFVRSFGGQVELNGNELTLRGPLKLPRTVEVDCSRTTQFASGLQLAFFNHAKIRPLNMTSSQSYWNLTDDLLVKMNEVDEYSIPLDWSSASYPLAFGALHQKIFFPGLKYDPYQADAKFLTLLKDLGAVTESDSGITVHPLNRPQSVRMDVSDCLDLVPTLSYLLAHIPGEHCLTGVANLAHKESDRLNEVLKMLNVFQRKASARSGSLLISGSVEKIDLGVSLRLPDDHRMVMAGALFLVHHSGGEISPAKAVLKSYPRFFELLEACRVP